MQGRNFESGLETGWEKRFLPTQHVWRRGGFSHKSNLLEGHLSPDGLWRLYYDIWSYCRAWLCGHVFQRENGINTFFLFWGQYFYFFGNHRFLCRLLTWRSSAKSPGGFQIVGVVTAHTDSWYMELNEKWEGCASAFYRKTSRGTIYTLHGMEKSVREANDEC